MPAIEYSAVYLESILLNLLSNALKYSSPCQIHFQSQIINDETVLTVCDNGLGIDLKEHDIFDLTKCSISTLTQKELISQKAQVEGMEVQ
jgi:K+-sensing histidine kinase KdpD